MMTLIVCAVLGLIAGYTTSQLLAGSRGGPTLNLVVGLAGALLGGYISLLVVASDGGVTLWSVLAAIAGAAVLLGVKQAILGSRPAHT